MSQLETSSVTNDQRATDNTFGSFRELSTLIARGGLCFKLRQLPPGYN